MIPTLTTEEYLRRFAKENEAQYDLTKAKNQDYSGSTNALGNFSMIEELTAGKITVEMGIVVRLTDKFKRMINLLSSDKEAAVKDEAVTDTLRDISVYCKILKLYLEAKKEQNGSR